MRHFEDTLANGLKVLTVPMPSLSSASVTVWVGVGSRYEPKRLGGISHFLEHMAFKGGRKYNSARKVAEAVDSIGAANNASTSHEITNYFVRTSTEQIERGFDVLSDMLLYPLLPEREIEKERGVILEEIKMYKDDPKSHVGMIYADLIFGDTPMGRNVIGTKQSVSEIQKEDFVNYRNKHINSSNMLITVAGGVKRDNVLKLTEKYFGALSPGKKGVYKKYTHRQKEPRVKVLTQAREQTNLIVGFPGMRYGAESRYAEWLLGVILSGGMSSRLFLEVREKRGLAYAVSAGSSRFRDTGEFSAYAGVPNDKVTKAIKVILDQFYRLADGKLPITARELEKAKNYTKGHFALGLERTDSVGAFFGMEKMMTGKVILPDEETQAVDRVTIDEVLDAARRIFQPSQVNIAVIGPCRDESKFHQILNFNN